MNQNHSSPNRLDSAIRLLKSQLAEIHRERAELDRAERRILKMIEAAGPVAEVRQPVQRIKASRSMVRRVIERHVQPDEEFKLVDLMKWVEAADEATAALGYGRVTAAVNRLVKSGMLEAVPGTRGRYRLTQAVPVAG